MSAQHRTEILLPLADNEGKPFDRELYRALQRDLTDKLGGATAFTRAPALGETKGDGGVLRDQIVIFEVMTDRINRDWWPAFRRKLERTFRQNEIVVRATVFEKL
jgi:hypothetical protein